MSTPLNTNKRDLSCLSSPEDYLDYKKNRFGSNSSENESFNYTLDCYTSSNIPDAMASSGQTTSHPLDQSVVSTIVDAVTENIKGLMKGMVENIASGVVSGLSRRITELEKQNETLQKTNEALLNRVSALEKSRDASEQYSRRNILRISGIPEPEPDENGDFPRENVDAVVMSVFKDIGSNVTVDEIDRAHRTGKPDPKGKPRAIIVKCVSFKAHQKAYTLRRNLNTQGRRGVFFNEDLTKERSDLL